ncbi:hypothetical protein B0T24DRAFT_325316 [Lasiosphaeria ovina]|uniref:Uncharacterized protein n=1 Tax=Lasiosphaeria ovina TaxID=92902 RepID=A0AAE0K8P2_9PEZI|nr:hypothetical protein B0T24DRAFT_325316 [Lasiosphaeria ovina]
MLGVLFTLYSFSFLFQSRSLAFKSDMASDHRGQGFGWGVAGIGVFFFSLFYCENCIYHLLSFRLLSMSFFGGGSAVLKRCGSLLGETWESSFFERERERIAIEQLQFLSFSGGRCVCVAWRGKKNKNGYSFYYGLHSAFNVILSLVSLSVCVRSWVVCEGEVLYVLLFSECVVGL